MALTALQRAAYRIFGRRAALSGRLEAVDEDLRRAQMPVRADAYMAYALLVAIVAAIAAGVVGVLAFLWVLQAFDVDPLVGILIPVLIAVAAVGTYQAVLGVPAARASRRGREIDAKLPYATNYITAMASAGIIPAEIFKSLASQQVYGECAREAAFIYKDLEVHGKDIVTAMRRAIDRSPSEKFKDLMQGAITTVTSGGDLTAYFYQKARRLQQDNRQEQVLFIESMGLMAEAYVTAAVAGPLFLLVMVAIFVLIGAGDLSMLQIMVYGLMPLLGLAFMLLLQTRIPEV